MLLGAEKKRTGSARQRDTKESGLGKGGGKNVKKVRRLVISFRFNGKLRAKPIVHILTRERELLVEGSQYQKKRENRKVLNPK